MAETVSGEVVILERDCECTNHAGPHWLHVDNLWGKLNKSFRERDIKAGVENAQSIFEREERLREKEKLRRLVLSGVSKLLT